MTSQKDCSGKREIAPKFSHKSLKETFEEIIIIESSPFLIEILFILSNQFEQIFINFLLTEVKNFLVYPIVKQFHET